MGCDSYGSGRPFLIEMTATVAVQVTLGVGRRGARSIRGDDLSDAEMLAPIRFVGRSAPRHHSADAELVVRLRC